MDETQPARTGATAPPENGAPVPSETGALVPAETGDPVPEGDAAGPEETDGTVPPEGGGAGEPDGGGRPWYRRLEFLVPAGVLSGLVGLFFVGLIVMLLLVGDPRRDRDLRIGGPVLLLWWLWTWTLPGTSPYIGAGLLLVAAVFLGRAARTASGRARAVTGGLALAAIALAVAGLVPYGVRQPDLGEGEALRLVLEARRGDPENVDAAKADVVPARERFTSRPYYFVVLHEQNPDRAVTGDGEPCFRRAEVHVVDGIDGSVERQRIADALPEDGNCLPLKIGTGAGLVPVDG